ncbi:hypothetical protein AK812_SmicGene13100 [Symbiodinium microadriaticum]|uniref:Uncharacterized protein n=1 Tax=Symbiodinium microadriaticum TaxID=2951 RepID=A0A1Q9E8X6_SYMMI|nr:hypothetical protein AK812_SmicGene13100 [Symbiodinium microadriaticum]
MLDAGFRIYDVGSRTLMSMLMLMLMLMSRSKSVGFVAERAALVEALARSGGVCPLSGVALSVDDCPRQPALRRRITKWIRERKAIAAQRSVYINLRPATAITLLLDKLVTAPRVVVRREVLRWSSALFPASAPEGIRVLHQIFNVMANISVCLSLLLSLHCPPVVARMMMPRSSADFENMLVNLVMTTMTIVVTMFMMTIVALMVILVMMTILVMMIMMVRVMMMMMMVMMMMMMMMMMMTVVKMFVMLTFRVAATLLIMAMTSQTTRLIRAM